MSAISTEEHRVAWVLLDFRLNVSTLHYFVICVAVCERQSACPEHWRQRCRRQLLRNNARQDVSRHTVYCVFVHVPAGGSSDLHRTQKQKPLKDETNTGLRLSLRNLRLHYRCSLRILVSHGPACVRGHSHRTDKHLEARLRQLAVQHRCAWVLVHGVRVSTDQLSCSQERVRADILRLH